MPYLTQLLRVTCPKDPFIGSVYNSQPGQKSPKRELFFLLVLKCKACVLEIPPWASSRVGLPHKCVVAAILSFQVRVGRNVVINSVALVPGNAY